MKSTGNSTAYASALSRYREHLGQVRSDPALARHALAALAAPGAVLKATPRQCVLRGAVAAPDLVFKFYTDRGLLARWRPSRARRAYAAARAMRELGLPVVEVAGIVEHDAGLAPYTSCLVMRWIPRATTLREWVRRQHRMWRGDDWAARRAELLELWLDLGRCGFYHNDTKTLNLLVEPDGNAPPRYWWIDPESVQPGHRPTRRQVLRNLVQLNGSLRGWVPESVRLEFLREASRAYPWLAEKSIERKIRRWTRRRLLNEKRTRCGP